MAASRCCCAKVAAVLAEREAGVVVADPLADHLRVLAGRWFAENLAAVKEALADEREGRET